MELKTTSTDLSIIKTLFDALPKDGIGELEIITNDGQVHTNLSWQEISHLHKQYGQVTLEYTRPE